MSGRSRRGTVATRIASLVVGAVLLFAPAARADERTEARAHFKKGMAAIVDGRYEAGIEELKKAYDILPHPNVLYNIARAYVDVGDLENALAYYRKYLEGNPPDRDEVERIVSSLDARMRKQQAQLVELQQAQSRDDAGAATLSGAVAAAAATPQEPGQPSPPIPAPFTDQGVEPPPAAPSPAAPSPVSQEPAGPAPRRPSPASSRPRPSSKRPSSPPRRRRRTRSTPPTRRRSSPSKTSAFRASPRSRSSFGGSPAST